MTAMPAIAIAVASAPGIAPCSNGGAHEGGHEHLPLGRDDRRGNPGRAGGRGPGQQVPRAPPRRGQLAVGIYLPLELSTPIFAGGLIAELATRWHKRQSPGGDIEKLKQMGLLFSAGLIAGEAIIGVLIAIPIVATKDANVLAVAVSMQPGKWAGIIVLSAVGWWLYRVATPRTVRLR
jgi:hypothetical protein